MTKQNLLEEHGTKQDQMTGKIYTPDDLVEILGIPKKTIMDHLRAGKLPGVKIGKHWRISEESLDKFMNTKGSKGKRNIRK
jgi:excisionase family DNA binding protein